MALYNVVYEIFNVEKCRDLEPRNPGQMSHKVIESGTVRQTVCSFLLVFYSNLDLRRAVLRNSTWF